jgi:glycerol uptake facilitator protein
VLFSEEQRLKIPAGIVITIGWGLAVAISVYAVGSFSGAHNNPAVTLALASVGEFPGKMYRSILLHN